MARRLSTRRAFIGKTLGTALGASLLTDRIAQSAQAAGGAAGGEKIRLSACIEAVFNRGPFEKRLEQVKAVGLTTFEFWGWRRRNIDAIKRKKDELGLECVIFSCDTGGPLVAPDSKKRFLPALRDSIKAARKLDCRRLIATVGNERKDISRGEQHKNIVEAMKAGAPLLEDAGVTICIEPLNVLVDHKGYYLATSREGFEIVDEVGSPNVRLLFDIYHQQITEGNLIRNITNNIKKIGHFHVADNPGRHQPGTGEINYFNVFRAIAKAGYTGALGLEMWPSIDHATAVKQTMKMFNEAVNI